MEQSGGRAAGVQAVNYLIADNLRVGAEHRGAARLKEVIVLIAVNIVQLGAVRLGENEREGVVEGQIVLDAAGDVVHRLVDHRLGLLTLFRIVLVLVLLELFGCNDVRRLFDQLVKLLGDGCRIMVLRDCKTVVHSVTSCFLII